MVAAVGIAALVVFVYRGLWNNAFYQDDYLWLDIARGIASDPSALFRADPDNSEALVRLTQRLVMGVVYAGFGTSPKAYHVVNLVLHVLASTIVFRLLLELHLRWGRPTRAGALTVAAFGALVFASTHHHAMAVLWVSAQSGLIETIAVAALALHLVRRHTSVDESRTRWVAVLLFLVALYSKNTAVGFAAVAAGFFWIQPLARVERQVRSAGLRLACLLIVLGALHLVFTKFVLVRLTGGSLGDNLGASSHTLANVSGAMLTPFLSASDFALWVGSVAPYPIVAVVWVALTMLVGRRMGMGRPILWAWLWVVTSSLPICFMKHEIYSAGQFTVNRYFYGAMVGAAILLSFLLRGLFERCRWPIAGGVLVLLLVSVHVGHHRGEIQERSYRFHEHGAADQRLIEATLRQARERVPAGSTIFARGWPVEETFLRRLGRVYLQGTGYGLEGENALREAVAEWRQGQGSEPWVALMEAENARFGVVPYSVADRAAPGRDR